MYHPEQVHTTPAKNISPDIFLLVTKPSACPPLDPYRTAEAIEFACLCFISQSSQKTRYALFPQGKAYRRHIRFRWRCFTRRLIFCIIRKRARASQGWRRCLPGDASRGRTDSNGILRHRYGYEYDIRGIRYAPAPAATGLGNFQGVRESGMRKV